MLKKITTQSGLDVLTFDTPLCKASLCIQGAHLTSWAPKESGEILFLSPRHEYCAGKAIRGGIPICWPWFGSKPEQPSHGIARIQNWELDSQSIDDDGQISLQLSLNPEDENLPSAILKMIIGESLVMTLQTTARKSSWKLTEAFHNYFKVSDYTKCLISGLSDTPFEEFSADATQHIEAPLCPQGPLDRIYDLEEPDGDIRLTDPIQNRVVKIAYQNTQSIIIWNPGQKLASQMADLGDEASDQFICVETGNVGKHSISLAPGETHTIKQKLTIR